MSDNFQACPGCESLILSDTESCPECGHVFKEGAVEPSAALHERGSTLHRECPKCGDEVPAGLVRCWSCNTFMREDVAEKYKHLVDNPQKIIFSDVPPDERTETIPPRAGKGGYARVLDAEEDEFTLQGDDVSAGTDLELQKASDGSPTTAPLTPPSFSMPVETKEPDVDASDQPAESSQTETEQQPDTSAADSTQKSDDAAPAKQVNADDLLDIALTQEKESDHRKRKRRSELNRKRILIPCPACGVWLRVREEQAGRTVRCRGCQTTVPVPQIRKKDKPEKEVDTPQVALDWLEDIHFHLVLPTDITLKPGSLQDSFRTADAVFTDDGLQLIALGGPPKKKSLFSRGGSDDLAQKRSEVREHISQSGGFSKLPHGELHTVSTDALNSIRLVQPVRKAHESMFAGVSVFGEGRIAVYLPLMVDGGQQAFCSMPLNLWRQFSAQLKTAGIELPAKANGVPEKEVHISPLCHYTQAKIESVREIAYYTNDDAFELELTGYRCAACGIAVSESARAKNKLGGAAGKSIAKAKCPKCSAKFGNEPMFKISRAPEVIEQEANDALESLDSTSSDKG